MGNRDRRTEDEGQGIWRARWLRGQRCFLGVVFWYGMRGGCRTIFCGRRC